MITSHDRRLLSERVAGILTNAFVCVRENASDHSLDVDVVVTCPECKRKLDFGLVVSDEQVPSLLKPTNDLREVLYLLAEEAHK